MHFLPHQYLDFARFHADWLQWIGTILLVASTLYTLWSRWILGRMWATNAAVKEGHQLVRSHGMYFSMYWRASFHRSCSKRYTSVTRAFILSSPFKLKSIADEIINSVSPRMPELKSV
jgi:protein-S-isoprenylcysteine O-methyltransferase Ste14